MRLDKDDNEVPADPKEDSYSTPEDGGMVSGEGDKSNITSQRGWISGGGMFVAVLLSAVTVVAITYFVRKRGQRQRSIDHLPLPTKEMELTEMNGHFNELHFTIT